MRYAKKPTLGSKLAERWGVLTRYHPTWALDDVDVKGTKRTTELKFREWKCTEEGRNASRSASALMKETIREEVENQFLRYLEDLNERSRKEAEEFRRFHKYLTQVLYRDMN